MSGLVIPLLILAAFYFWTLFAKASAERRQGLLRSLGWGAGLLVFVVIAVRSGQLMLAAVVSLVLVGLRLLPELSAANRAAQRGASSEQRPAKPERVMTRAEALRILDLPEAATAEEVNARYRNLIKAVHPDRGGSAYLAAQLNNARDALLKADRAG
jgi:hypothetical protein